MTEPGNIQFRQRASQIAKFDGLRLGEIWPSDIDGIYDFGGKAFIVFELKSGDTPIKRGQQLLLENMVNGWRDGQRIAAAMVARHDSPIGQDIDAGAAKVSDVWFNGKWFSINDGATLREMVERFLKKHVPTEWQRLTGATPSQDAHHNANGRGNDTSHGHKIETPSRAIPAATPHHGRG